MHCTGCACHGCFRLRGGFSHPRLQPSRQSPCPRRRARLADTRCAFAPPAALAQPFGNRPACRFKRFRRKPRVRLCHVRHRGAHLRLGGWDGWCLPWSATPTEEALAYAPCLYSSADQGGGGRSVVGQQVGALGHGGAAQARRHNAVCVSNRHRVLGDAGADVHEGGFVHAVALPVRGVTTRLLRLLGHLSGMDGPINSGHLVAPQGPAPLAGLAAAPRRVRMRHRHLCARGAHSFPGARVRASREPRLDGLWAGPHMHRMRARGTQKNHQAQVHAPPRNGASLHPHRKAGHGLVLPVLAAGARELSRRRPRRSRSGWADCARRGRAGGADRPARAGGAARRDPRRLRRSPAGLRGRRG
mmetsp:Transcript_2688/g.8984  ORF Transcript_2688/g.8984 Transcript_2688/m.8984 type:complete len:359 (+) Transcript_2688:1103-2179(+)